MALLKDPRDHSPETLKMLLSQWSVCVSQADAISNKRLSANNIYITVNAALVALMSFTSDWQNCMIAVLGVIVVILWLCSIKSYRRLNAAKYQVILELEKHLPAAPMDAEWNILKGDKKYHRLTSTERILPVVFLLLYILMPVLSFLFP